METALAVVLILTAVAIHELFHSMVAIALGVKVEKVFIGYPVFFTRSTEIAGITVTFSPLLFAFGIEPNEEELWKLSLRRKVLVYAYGAFGNLAVALFLATAILGVYTGPRVTLGITTSSVSAIIQLVTMHVRLADISGPLGLVMYTATFIRIQFGMGTLLSWLLINCGLAVFNVLPIPALDGGHIFLSARLRYHPDGRETWKKISSKSAVVLMVVMLLLTVKDYLQWFG